MTTDYNKLSKAYQQFIDREKAYNDHLISGQVEWYDTVVSTNTHFERIRLGNAAKKEYSILKRLTMLNAFEHISSMQRAYDLRKLDYADYLSRHSMSTVDDSANLQKLSNDYNGSINKGTNQA